MTYREWLTLGMERLRAAGIEDHRWMHGICWNGIRHQPFPVLSRTEGSLPGRGGREVSEASGQRERGAFLCSRSWVIQSLWD